MSKEEENNFYFITFFLPLILSIVTFGNVTLAEQPKTKHLEEIENAVLEEEWETVVQLLSKGDNSSLPIEYRAIKGHACLATNRNNESLELFSSILDDSYSKVWQAWADDFANRYPDSAIAMYFAGDAYARQKEWKKADQYFDKAIKLDSECYLAFNARGVVSHAVGNTIMARMYFQKAVKTRKDFADAYASRGTLNIYVGSMTKDATAGSEVSFTSAKEYSLDPHPILPTLGTGCVHYAKQEYMEAKNCFEAVPVESDIALIAQSNILTVEADKMLQALSKAQKTGTFIQSKEYELKGDQKVEVQESDKGLSVSFSNNDEWGITGIDIHIPPFVTIHWGPKAPSSEDEEKENANKDKQGSDNDNQSVRPNETDNTSTAVVASTTGPGKRGGRGGGIHWPPSWRPPIRPGQGQPRPGEKRKKTNIANIPEFLPTAIRDIEKVMPEGDEQNHYIMMDAIEILSSIVDAVSIEINRDISMNGSSGLIAERSDSISNKSQYGGVDANVGSIPLSGREPKVSMVYGLLYPIPRSETLY